MDKKFSIIGPYAPASYISCRDGKRYACSGSQHVEIPMNMPYHEILAGWIDNNTKKSTKPLRQPEGEVFLIRSSKGDKDYEVALNKGSWSCNCRGYGFYKHCDHIQQAKVKKEQQTTKV